MREHTEVTQLRREEEGFLRHAICRDWIDTVETADRDLLAGFTHGSFRSIATAS